MHTPCSAPLRSVPALALTVLFALFGAALPAQTDMPADKSALVPHVTVARASRAEVVDEIPVSGSTTPRQEVLVFPKVGGFAFESIFVDVGDQVSAGDVLAQMETRVLESQLLQAKAEQSSAQASVRQAQSQIDAAEAALDNAENKLTRAQQLADRGNLANADLETARANAQSARASAASAHDGLAAAKAAAERTDAAVGIAESNLGHATINAPVDGLILARNGNIGMIATTGGDPMFRIAENGRIEVEAEVIETALGSVSEGDPVALEIAGVGAVPGKVRLISPAVNPATRLGRIYIETDEQRSLPSGVFASGMITIDRHQGLTVPSSAVLVDKDSTYVLRITEEGVVQRVDVTAGLIYQNQREILNGLAEGDVVMLRAGTFFGDGDKVQPVFAEGAGQ